MSTDRLQYLLDKLFHHQCTQDEKEELALWVDTLPDELEWKDRISRIWNSFEPLDKMEPSKAEAVLKEILDNENEKASGIKTLNPRYTSISGQMMRWSVAAAAVIGILIILSIIFLSKKPLPSSHPLAANSITGQNDIKPGGNKATLTLANGKTIILNSVQNGLIASQNNNNIIKVSSGLLKFTQQTAYNTQPTTISYNTITT
ncbi:MAG: hypothetical protein ACRDE2_12385, partial [Chitinophagaceae bacterium]